MRIFPRAPGSCIENFHAVQKVRKGKLWIAWRSNFLGCLFACDRQFMEKVDKVRRSYEIDQPQVVRERVVWRWGRNYDGKFCWG